MSAHRVAHHIGQAIVHAWEHVAVGVEGYGNGRVAQELLHKLSVDAPAEKDRGAGVPQVVEADLGQPRALKGPFEGPAG